jgi:hypothetical protein
LERLLEILRRLIQASIWALAIGGAGALISPSLGINITHLHETYSYETLLIFAALAVLGVTWLISRLVDWIFEPSKKR